MHISTFPENIWLLLFAFAKVASIGGLSQAADRGEIDQMNCHLPSKLRSLFLPFTLTCLPVAFGQGPCAAGVHVSGSVSDPSGAMIVGAQVRTNDGQTTVSDQSGHFTLACVPLRSTTALVTANGFFPVTKRFGLATNGAVEIRVQLALASVQFDVQVEAGADAVEADTSTGTITLDSNRVQQLADDPDEFMRQLQTLASTTGADTASIMVDGFRNRGVPLPPKASIASIRINPDIFAPEFASPPWTGALLQITTKPGATDYHGSIFMTDSNSVFNANDPFSASPTPARKRRYGFDLTGPLLAKKLDFAVALEKRDIDEYNVVNAIRLGSNGEGAKLQQSVSAPQRLWIGSARVNSQVSPVDTAELSFSANTNTLGNVGVGGLSLLESGYQSRVGQYDLHLFNSHIINATLLNETRLGFTWRRMDDTPLSTAPSLQVAGFFNGGGSMLQNVDDRERDLEADDDVILSSGKNTVKFGAQVLGIFLHDTVPTLTNGAYVFGGGSAPVLDSNGKPTGQTTTITALEQYRRALNGSAGGTPTTYAVTTGSPLVALSQWHVGLYVQDAVKLKPNLSITGGVRYQLQSFPGDWNNVAPRAGLAWSPDKKQTWVFHVRCGLFFDPIAQSYLIEANRLDRRHQQQITVYSPNYQNPLGPVAGSVQVSTVNQFQPAVHQVPSFSFSFEADKDFPQHWHVHAWYLNGGVWGMLRLRNINAPMVATSIGASSTITAALQAPRPTMPNENIMQYENSGHFRGPMVGLSLSQNHFKRIGFTVSYKYEDVTSDGGDNDGLTITSPQSSYTNRGESCRVDWNHWNTVTATAHATLPLKVDLSLLFDGRNGSRYNMLTGTDNNGDGNFNDRPSLVSSPDAGVYQTRFGLLTTNTVNGTVPRNLGTLPSKFHLDLNANRNWTLKTTKRQATLTLNARSSNLLNHTNVTAVGTVISSTNFAAPISAESARRVEFGIRASF